MIIFHFSVIPDDEGNDAIFQALLKKNHSSRPSVAVLEGVDFFIFRMEPSQITQAVLGRGVIPRQKFRHTGFHFLRQRGHDIRNHVPSVFVFADGISVGDILKNTAFQFVVVAFDEVMGQGKRIGFQHFVEHQEMPGHLLYVFRPDHGILRRQRSGIEQGGRLLFRQRAALDFVGIVSQHSLGKRVNPSAVMIFLLDLKTLDQCFYQMFRHGWSPFQVCDLFLFALHYTGSPSFYQA